MVRFPGGLSVRSFLQTYWQKKPLFMANALERVTPSLSRNELAWLATQDDVESRIVFVDRHKKPAHYRVETGPFDVDFLQNLPKRDWTLLVHDVEKHIPAMRGLFRQVPFIPDWRIDDLMVSFAAPGGGVGPHKDHYDVFLCQGIGQRHWRFSTDEVAANEAASADIALLQEFSATKCHDTVAGDVLYLPPLVAHWGTATRACMTYSIGMRAPQASDLRQPLARSSTSDDVFYRDEDLVVDEAQPGFISANAVRRATHLAPGDATDLVARKLGCCVTQTKPWLTPDPNLYSEHETELTRRSRLVVHGMSRIAYDGKNVYLNGLSCALPESARETVARLCKNRALTGLDVSYLLREAETANWLRWLLEHSAFEQTARL